MPFGFFSYDYGSGRNSISVGRKKRNKKRAKMAATSRRKNR